MKNREDIRFVFFGTPDLAVTVLDELETAGLVPTLVITRPDALQGRGRVLTPPPVKVWAEKRGTPVLQPERIDAVFIDELRQYCQQTTTHCQLFIVAAYGKILPKKLLDIPARGVLNMHPSLLPRLRGPSPIRSAILTDEKETGVSIMLVDEQMDHGPVIAQQPVVVSDWPPRASVLEDILSHEGGRLLARVLTQWVAGEITPVPQDDSRATYCEKLTKEGAKISLTDDSYQNLLKIRAYEGMPGAYTFFERNGKRIRVIVTDAHLNEKSELVVDRVIPEGKREMPYEDFLRSGATPCDPPSYD
jgi:methionyl-tRNA formyltransferase